jgi:hypothetical protein
MERLLDVERRFRSRRDRGEHQRSYFVVTAWALVGQRIKHDALAASSRRASDDGDTHARR